MLALFIKFSLIFFCSVVSVDAFFKAKRYLKEIEDDLLNPNMGKVLHRRAIRVGVIFGLAALMAVATLFFRIPPFGE